MEWGLLVMAIAVFLLVTASDRLATARLQRIERKLDALLRHHAVDTRPGVALSDRVKQLAADPAQKIHAIKAYREETGAGLAEAKEAVEAFINSNR